MKMYLIKVITRVVFLILRPCIDYYLLANKETSLSKRDQAAGRVLREYDL